jgi:hypothetical protein
MTSSSAPGSAVMELARTAAHGGWRRSSLAAAVAALGIFCVWLLALTASLFPSQPRAGEAPRQPILDSYGKLPLSFVPNAGQVDRSVRYQARGPGFDFNFTPDKAVLSFTRGDQGVALHLTPLGASKGARLEGRGKRDARVNYLIGHERHTNLQTYRAIAYRELWPGVDLVFRSGRGALKYELRVAPGADPSKVRLGYRGADRLSLGARGDLLIDTPLGTLRDSRPHSYQRIGGKRIPVASRYALRRGGNAYGFELDSSYDARHPLVIDPGLAYSTFLGGVGGEHGLGVAVDGAGNAYVTGFTSSLDYPTAGAFDPSQNGNSDAFVTKLDASGSALAYSTYLGGNGYDEGAAIAVDGNGSAYVTGQTQSGNFPTTPAAFDTTHFGFRDAFITKLDPSGSALAYSTYLGGAPDDEGFGIAVDASGNAYVTGRTRSPGFPTTPSAFDRRFNGGFYDVFVTKMDATGSAALYSTYLGGADWDEGVAIAVDEAGDAYVTGRTVSANFPTTAGAIDRSLAGYEDAFVTKIRMSESALAYSTYLGGDSFDEGFGIAVDGSGSAYVSGFTFSSDFPTTAGAFDRTHDGSDAFVSKLDSLGAGLVYSTYLGGTSADDASGVDVDGNGRAHVTGRTVSLDFPTTQDALDRTFNGGSWDAFVTTLDAAGSGLEYSTYLGGAEFDVGQGIAVDTTGNAYVSGATSSPDFPTTEGAFDSTFNGQGGFTDVFVTKLFATAGAPATLVLEPATATNPVGSSHCVTATVKDRFGAPTPGVTIRFSVTGTQQLRRSAVTDRNGNARFCYTGMSPGTDTIRAFADADRDGIRDPGEPQGQATKTWTPKPALDHFLYYPIQNGTPAFQPRTVTVRDQFRTSQARVVEPLRLLNPASKDGSTISRPGAHLKCYRIEESRFAGRTVSVRNQLAAHTFQVRQPTRLCNPASKKVPPGTPPPIPSGLDHFRCYGVEGSSLNRAVTLRDQFGRQQVAVQEPEYLCNPASKNGSTIQHPAPHLVCYELGGVDPFVSRRASMRDQFGVQTFTVSEPTKLCVPSRKQT